MNQYDVDAYMQTLLHIAEFTTADPSQNGLQVANSGKKITRLALAVDACMQTIERAAAEHADMLFVHHGLFWNNSPLITKAHYNRIHALLSADIALYAVHLPLDAHPVYGNNAGLAELLHLKNIRPFGNWRGHAIGCSGTCSTQNETSCTLDDILTLLRPIELEPHILPFGPKEINRIAVLSGAGAGEFQHAISENIDLYITGEIKQEIYHAAYDNRIHVIAAGHYATETLGVQRAAKKLTEDSNIHAFFIDVPTGI